MISSFFYNWRNLIIVAATTAKRIVIVKAKGKQLALICSIKLAVGYTYGPFLWITSKHCKTFSCTTRDPESELPVVQVLWWVNWFPICIGQALQRSQRAEAHFAMVVDCEITVSSWALIHVITKPVSSTYGLIIKVLRIKRIYVIFKINWLDHSVQLNYITNTINFTHYRLFFHTFNHARNIHIYKIVAI